VVNLLLMTLTLVAIATSIYHTSGTGGKFTAGVIDTGGKFAIGVIDTCSKFSTCDVDNSGAP
jgi:hypothetical protein